MESLNPPQTSGNTYPSASIPPELITEILDSLDGIVYVADIHTHSILYANRYVRRMFGFDPCGRKCWQLIHGEHESNCELCTSGRLLNAAGEPAGIFYREYQNPFNKKWYGAKDQAIKWSDGRYVRLEVALDITEHKQLQSFLGEARKQAEMAVTVKNRFVSLVAHDLKSPFVSILGMLRRILKKETFEYDIHRKFLENIINNGQRMLKMIDHLLDMDRLETGRIKPELSYFDVSRMVEEVLENFSHLAAAKHLTLNNSVPGETEIYADKYLYFVVLNNLVSNAVKFSYDRGSIVISYEQDQDMSRLVVVDQGKGISKAYTKDIFRPDVKTTTTGTGGETGTGLGLVFCQQIMQAHGGCIELESVEGKGTTFYVELGPSCRLPEDEREPN